MNDPESQRPSRALDLRSSPSRPDRSNRTYWILTTLLDKMRYVVESDLLPPGERILDYGCGSKPYRGLFDRKFTTYVGADLPGNIDADLTLGPGGHIPAADGSFDCVLSSQVLEHVEDPSVYLAQARRVLKPGGMLLLSTHGIWPYHPHPTDYRRWTLDGLQREIQRAGFEVLLTQSIFDAPTAAIQLWQDATFERLPRILQPMYLWSLQTLIGVIERRHPDKLSTDAMIYVILARRAATDRERLSTSPNTVNAMS
jgi:SAM-dependent methyltransferase